AEDGIRDGHVTGVQTCALPILLNTLYYRRNSVLITTKVNQAIVLLMTAANMTSSNTTSVITPTTFGFFLQQGRVWLTFMQIRVYHADDKAATGRCWFTFYNSHCNSPLYSATAKSIS